jgi:hypothetical protein
MTVSIIGGENFLFKVAWTVLVNWSCHNKIPYSSLWNRNLFYLSFEGWKSKLKGPTDSGEGSLLGL